MQTNARLTRDKIGTGIWAIEFGASNWKQGTKVNFILITCVAEQYPSARVLGTDLSAIQHAQ
jgi:hypothetical protein